MQHRFTTIGPAIDKLLEAEHFLALSVQSNGLKFQFEVNAFLSAARNVTFVLQACLADVPMFKTWYEALKERMKSDHAMKCFTELRNISLKQGPVAMIGGASLNGYWSYRFVATQLDLPAEMMDKDLRIVCADHLTKLASILNECRTVMPFNSCPYEAFSEEGMNALGYRMEDAEVAAGYPPGWSSVVDFPVEQKLRYLRKEIQPIDAQEVERISNGVICGDGGPVDFSMFSGDGFLGHLVEAVNRGNHTEPRLQFLSAIGQAISEHEGK